MSHRPFAAIAVESTAPPSQRPRHWSLAGGALIAIALAACHPPVGPAIIGPVPVERGPECRRACDSLGMRLTSVVLIINVAGCVCQVIEPAAPSGPPGSPPVSSSASAAGGAEAATGGAAIAAIYAAQQHQQQQRRQQQQQRH